MKPTHRWLNELANIPTTSGHEFRVIAWVRAWVERRSDLRLRSDAAGNLLVTIKGRRRREPIIATAHMDHPGWVIEEIDGRDVSARFMGGVHPQYFPGAPVKFFTDSDESVLGAVQSLVDGLGSIRLSKRHPGLAIDDIGRWRYRPNALGVRGDRLRAPACDDLAGAAAALAALDVARHDASLSHFGVLLTRAEEEGLLGAIAACELGTIPPDSRLLSIETSRSFDDSPIGRGPIVRVGDLSSIFDADLTNAVTDAARRTGITHQRKLMAGGSCEATAFGAYGYRATGLCLALGNYHNMVDIDGVLAGRVAPRLAAEEISLSDYDGLIRLMLCVVAGIDGTESAIRDRLASNYDARRGLLGL